LFVGGSSLWSSSKYKGFSAERFQTSHGINGLGAGKPLFSAKRPFENPPKIPEKIQWVKPKLVCEVAFAEWTEDEQMRQTTFLSLREDKDPKEVVREV
jgi:ATP-dependent DNA ligase